MGKKLEKPNLRMEKMYYKGRLRGRRRNNSLKRRKTVRKEGGHRSDLLIAVYLEIILIGGFSQRGPKTGGGKLI